MALDPARRGTLLAEVELDALQWGAGGMLFTVRHVTACTCNQPVCLAPHWLRLRPRGSDPIGLQHFGLDIDPAPAGRAECLDPQGSRVARVWFDGETRHLTIVGHFSARTHRRDASRSPEEPAPCEHPYPAALRARLSPWIDGSAARCVSGCQRGRGEADLRSGEASARRRHMHAWPDVYRSGRGWRGFDSTHGAEVADAHVALAAAAESADAAPIEGSYFGAAQATLRTTRQIDVGD